MNDVFEKVWEGSIFPIGGTSFGNLVCKCSRNASIDMVRKRKIVAETLSDDEQSTDSLSLSSRPNLEGMESLISKVLNDEELFIFLSRAEKEMPFREIASSLGISEDAASSIYTRARKKLLEDPDIFKYKSRLLHMKDDMPHML